MPKLALTALLFAAACGGGDTGPVTVESAHDACEKLCAHDAACEVPPVPTSDACITDCASRVAGWARAETFNAVADCEDGAACTVTDDSCLAEVEAQSIDHDFEDRCREALATCDTAAEIDALCDVDSSTSDSRIVIMFSDDIVAQLTACFDQPGCQAPLDCINAIIGPYLGSD